MMTASGMSSKTSLCSYLQRRCVNWKVYTLLSGLMHTETKHQPMSSGAKDPGTALGSRGWAFKMLAHGHLERSARTLLDRQGVSESPCSSTWPSS